MTNSHQTQNVAPPPNILAFARPEHRLDANSDRALARREAELRAALAQVQALRRQRDRLTRQSGSVVHALYAARETAAFRVATLSPREQEVLELVLAGRPSKIIAWELSISQRTVDNHRATIMKKTGSKSIPALARLAIAAAWDGVDEPTVQRLDHFALAADWPASRCRDQGYPNFAHSAASERTDPKCATLETGPKQ
jgi:DNA-binding CsgD family transcriptional regulator